MFRRTILVSLAVLLASWSALNAENVQAPIKKSGEQSALTQLGGEPFHQKAAIASGAEGMQFTAFAVQGSAVQMLAQATAPSKDAEPAHAVSFDSARNYFDHGRKVGFLAWNGTPYTLRADFQFRDADGTLETGHYEDTWLNGEQWLRKAELGQNRCERSRSGDELYRLIDGQQSSVMCLVMDAMEPIPATGKFTESDWRIKRDTVDGAAAIRVLSGYESPQGVLDPDQARGYWFDDSGLLLKTFVQGIETDRADFQEFGGIKVAHKIDVRKGGKVAMQIRVIDVSAPGTVAPDAFKLKGHDWQRATDDAR